jgi:hypothetical protein
MRCVMNIEQTNATAAMSIELRFFSCMKSGKTRLFDFQYQLIRNILHFGHDLIFNKNQINYKIML